MATKAKAKSKGTNHWIILILLALAQFMVVLDASIANIALPTIQKAFHMTTSNLQWIVTAYSLTFGGFLLFGGRFADLFGRRRTFLGGIICFTLFSLGTGLSQSSSMIIIFRALQGLAAAFMSPAALSIVLVTYKEGHERNVAISVWGAVASSGAAAGLLAGGILTQYINWRWDFIVNVPVGILVIATAFAILPKHESEADHNDLDVLGAASVTLGLMSLVYGLTEASTYSWLNHRATIWFGVFIVLISLFIWNESRVKHPIMPLTIFKIRSISAGDTAMLCLASAMFGVFFFTTLYLQEILDYSPVKTGLSFLVLPVAIGAVASNVPKLVKRVGYKPIIVVAPVVVAIGLFYLSFIPVHGSYLKNIMPGLILMGLGMGGSFVGITIAATTGVSKQESGLASGLLNTAQQLGGAVGLAAIAGIAASTARHTIARAKVHSVASNAIATVHGYHIGYIIAACLALAASAITGIFMQNNKPKINTASTEEAAIMA